MTDAERIGELQSLLGMTREEAEESVRDEAVRDAIADERSRVLQMMLGEAALQERVAAKMAPQGIERAGHEAAAQALRDFAAVLEARS